MILLTFAALLRWHVRLKDSTASLPVLVGVCCLEVFCLVVFG